MEYIIINRRPRNEKVPMPSSSTIWKGLVVSLLVVIVLLLLIIICILTHVPSQEYSPINETRVAGLGYSPATIPDRSAPEQGEKSTVTSGDHGPNRPPWPLTPVLNSTEKPEEPQYVTGRDWQMVGDLPTNSILGGHTTVVFNNSLWVIDGATIWNSDDGITWHVATDHAAFQERRDFAVVVFNNRLWLIGGFSERTGYKNDIWSSSDGTTWSVETLSAPFSPRWGHQALVFKNRMWVIGGITSQNLGDVWSSADGKKWVLEMKNTGFPPRFYHQTLVYGGRMWVIGGTGNKKIYTDVWSSTDGKNWMQVNADAFPPMEGGQAVVFRDRMWIFGGEGMKIEVNAFVSSDGNTWNGSRTGLPSSARYWAQAVSFRNRLVVIDSQEGKVWQSPPQPLSSAHCREINAGTITQRVFSLYDGNPGTVPVVRMWVFSGSRFSFSDMRIPVGGGFARDFTMEEFSPGPNTVIFQYAGPAKTFDIGYNASTRQVVRNSENGSTVLFNLTEERLRIDPGAVWDVVDAINGPAVRDTCSVYSFALDDSTGAGLSHPWA
jgi:hypothetical protein